MPFGFIGSSSSGSSSVSAPQWTVTAIKIAAYTAAINEWVRTNPTAGGFTVTLPASAAANSGKTIVVSNESDSPNTVTIAPNGADTIGGQASYSLAIPRGEVLFADDGSGNWMIGV